jgi:cytochrome c oxidase cbb3-type subunit 3
MIRLLLFIPAVLLSTMRFSQGTQQVQQSFWSDPLHHPLLPYYIVMTFVFVVIVLIAWVAFYLMKVLKMFTTLAERQKKKRLGVPYVPSLSWWQKFSDSVNAAVPVEAEKSIELDHSYDGIKELDNHLPPWWKGLFYGTIAFAVGYLVIFHMIDSLPLQQQEYENELTNAEESVRAFRASQPQAEIDENALIFKADAAIIEKGKSVFMSNNCGACHRNDGGGNTIGPNLTDSYWLHGGEIKNIFHTIKNGVVEKGMPAWGKAMSAQDVRNVAFFVMSLEGTNPPNAKPPQGEIFKVNVLSKDSTNAQASLK